MHIIADTELILTPENKIYHLNLSKEEIADDKSQMRTLKF